MRMDRADMTRNAKPLDGRDADNEIQGSMLSYFFSMNFALEMFEELWFSRLNLNWLRLRLLYKREKRFILVFAIMRHRKRLFYVFIAKCEFSLHTFTYALNDQNKHCFLV